jgi:hypothetical protein
METKIGERSRLAARQARGHQHQSSRAMWLLDDASSVGFKSGMVYALKTLGVLLRLLLHRSGLVQSRKFRVRSARAAQAWATTKYALAR